MMRSERPDVEKDGRYPVMRACEKLGISRRTLEQYRCAGRIHAEYREADNRKVYTGREILRCWQSAM